MHINLRFLRFELSINYEDIQIFFTKMINECILFCFYCRLLKNTCNISPPIILTLKMSLNWQKCTIEHKI